MEKLGYEKVIRISLLGFVILSLVIMIVVNLYFSESAVYEASKEDIKYSGEALTATSLLNEEFERFENSLKFQADVLSYVFSREESSNTEVTDRLIYLEEDLVSMSNSEGVEENTLSGNVVLKGRVENITEKQFREINQLGTFYRIADIMFAQEDLAYPSIYYSGDDYLLYYPYTSNDLDVIAYFGVFEGVKEIISRIYEFSPAEQKDAIQNGWSQTNINQESGIVTFNKTYPIVVDNQVSGLLVGHITEEELGRMIKVPRGVDAYLINESNQIVYSNVTNLERTAPAEAIFQDKYNISYYNNQFPIPIEVREAGNYRTYITKLNQTEWRLIYVVKENFVEKKAPIIIFNLFLFTLIGSVLFFAVRYSSSKRNTLAEDARQSKFDQMTQLLNHIYIKKALELYLTNKRIKQITVMMIDIDHFKEVNDTHGHTKGDDIIIVTANTIEDVLNNYVGVVGRYGGEEYMVILPRMEKDLAFKLAERIREKVSYRIKDRTDLNITVSVGVHFQTLPTKMKAIELINIADGNLYRAKENGRNQVVSSESS